VGFVLGLLGHKLVRVVIVVVVVVLGWTAVNKGISLFRSVNSASFSTASLSLTADDATGGEAYSALDLTHLAPGADIYMGLSILNSGGTDFRYAMVTTSSGDGTLDKDLRVGVAAVAGGCDSGAYSAGTKLYNDHQGLDRAQFTGRALASGASDHLCFHVRFPLKLPSSLGLKSASATFDFTAARSLSPPEQARGRRRRGYGRPVAGRPGAGGEPGQFLLVEHAAWHGVGGHVAG
jgi:hypothetical protein